jgi:hypothetical protein
MFLTILAIVFLVLFVGWVLNLIKLFKHLKSDQAKTSLVTPMFIARLVGVFALPIGGILGYIS